MKFEWTQKLWLRFQPKKSSAQMKVTSYLFTVNLAWLCSVQSRSLMKIENSTGPRTLPWGTPDKTCCQDENLPLTLTLCDLPVSQAFTQAATLPSTPCALSFLSSLAVGTLSNALAKSGTLRRRFCHCPPPS